VIVILLSLH